MILNNAVFYTTIFASIKIAFCQQINASQQFVNFLANNYVQDGSKKAILKIFLEKYLEGFRIKKWTKWRIEYKRYYTHMCKELPFFSHPVNFPLPLNQQQHSNSSYTLPSYIQNPVEVPHANCSNISEDSELNYAHPPEYPHFDQYPLFPTTPGYPVFTTTIPYILNTCYTQQCDPSTNRVFEVPIECGSAGAISPSSHAQTCNQLPHPDCYINSDGYLCCDPEMEENLSQSFLVFKHRCKKHAQICRVHPMEALADHIQKGLEKTYGNKTFESMITGVNTASKIQFASKRFCKIRRNCMVIMAFASPNQVFPDDPPIEKSTGGTGQGTGGEAGQGNGGQGTGNGEGGNANGQAGGDNTGAGEGPENDDTGIGDQAQDSENAGQEPQEQENARVAAERAALEYSRAAALENARAVAAQDAVARAALDYSRAGGYAGEDPVANAFNTLRNRLCFSGDMEVWTYDGLKKLKDLNIGEYVMSSSLNYTKVINWLHNSPQTLANFLHIYLNDGSNLKITPKHLIYKANCFYSNSDGTEIFEIDKNELIFAEELKIGDCLYVVDQTKSQFTIQHIQQIKIITEMGIFAPETGSGDIVVNNIVASCYTDIKNRKISQIMTKRVTTISIFLNNLLKMFYQIEYVDEIAEMPTIRLLLSMADDFLPMKIFEK